MPDQSTVTDAAEYLQRLCRSMSRSKLDRMGIKLVLAAGTVWLHSERCWQLGMIVYELVTNVARHAFFEGRDGEVRVELSRAGAFARCGVSDNGSTAAGARPGRGLKIIGDLAKSLGRVSRNGRDLERENKPVFYLTEDGSGKAVTNL
jgi:two-component sensor histidine kinase